MSKPNILICAAAGIGSLFHFISAASACGLQQSTGLPIGTPVQMMTVQPGDVPSMNFSQSNTVVTRAEVIAKPCHGVLRKTRPLGYRYVLKTPGFVGRDTYALRACNARGECSITAAVLTFVR